MARIAGVDSTVVARNRSAGKGLSALHEIRIAVIQHVQNDNSNADPLCRMGDPQQSVGEQMAAIALSGISLVHTDHRNEGGWDRAVDGRVRA